MQHEKKTKNKSLKDSEVLHTARERFDLAVEAEASIRSKALDDLKFRAGEQWPDDIKQSRDMDRRPCLTINRLPQFIRQVTNDQRQNRPSIKVNPVDDKADVETAKIFQGLIRHIEYTSNADVAYDTAFEGAAIKGLGYFRILTDYVDPMSFEQEIRIKRIKNSFSVYVDPTYQEPDGSDMNWAFVIDDMSEDDFKAHFKGSQMSQMEDWSSIGDKAPGWASKSSCRIAEYFYKTFKEVTLCLLNTGEVIEKSKLPDELPEMIEIVQERESVLPAIKWCKINAVEVLEETDWLGQWIPIVPVLGDEIDINGSKELEGIIRHAKDPQRMFNYWASAETETIALSPRAPFIGVEGQFEGHEAQWKTANIKNHAYLEYKPKSVAGQPAGAPQRNVFEAPVQAITQARMQSAEDLKATTGIYDASLGNRSNENSGVAIQRRNMQAQTNNFHYVDNLSRSLRHAGRIIIDLIPKIYDTARTVRILGEDGEPEIVQVNQVFEKKGQAVHYDLGLGKYDVTVATGPSFATKRQEAVEAMLSLTQSYPKVAEVAGDLMVKNMDWPGAQEIAERLKKSLPPGLVENEGDQAPIPPQVKAQMDQMSQMVEQLTQHLHAAQDKLDHKTIELESRERIEFAKIQANIEIEMAKMGSQEAQTLLKNEVAEIQSRLELLRINQAFQDESEGNEMGAGPAQAFDPNETQVPTGGFSPGQPVE